MNVEQTETTKLKNVTIEGNIARIKVNTKVFPVEVVQKAAYILMDKATATIDGDPDNELVVELLKTDNKLAMDQLVVDFNNELLNYAVYKAQSEQNKELREIMLQRILLTNDPKYRDAIKKIASSDQIDDPENIMKTWEETHSEHQ